MTSSQRPTKSNAQDAAATFLGHERFTLTRYPTGLCHYVFEVIPDSGPKVVVRMGHEDTRKHLEGSVFWDMELMPLKLPTARILHHELAAEFPYTILEHIKGADLGQVYSTLAPSVRQQIGTPWQRFRVEWRSFQELEGLGTGSLSQIPDCGGVGESFLMSSLIALGSGFDLLELRRNLTSNGSLGS